jgi:hypothetical protein
MKIPVTKAGFVMRSGKLGDVEQTAMCRAGIRRGMLGDVEQTAMCRAGIRRGMLGDVEQTALCRAGIRRGMLGDVEQTAMSHVVMTVSSISFVVRRETKRDEPGYCSVSAQGHCLLPTPKASAPGSALPREAKILPYKHQAV